MEGQPRLLKPYGKLDVWIQSLGWNEGLQKLRMGIPNLGDPVLDPKGEAVVGALMGGHLREIQGEAIVGDPMRDAIMCDPVRKVIV